MKSFKTCLPILGAAFIFALAVPRFAKADNSPPPEQVTVSRTSGDANGNNLLDPGETWIYTCRTNIPVSTRNVAMAQGMANGFTTSGYAFATVLVSAPAAALTPTPSLPNAGLPPERKSIPWNIAILAGVLVLVSISFVVVLKKYRI